MSTRFGRPTVAGDGGPPKPITSVLVANRGEIARRIFRTARAQGYGCVAVFSDEDATAPFVREADCAVRLPGRTPAETYLRGDLIVAAALQAGADAIHPGYGFLSENADFARAVLAAGLTWIGPPPDAIERMGSKIESKRLMSAAGVPVLAELKPEDVTAADLPVLIKASAGGGGRGMRVVRALDAMAAEADAARAEAQNAFGDGTVFCEPYLGRGRHIEVQVMADRQGRVWAVGERECSIQRRHQKVIEEAPSPLVERTPGMRAALFEAAEKATRAVAYEGAGTVEFIADEAGRFFFLEMNTRLQVEHPVTEETTGLDLVALQFEVADGKPLGATPPPTRGHAIEVRLYAEDPAADWRPQSGTLHRFAVPDGVRVDSGVEDGSVVGVHYDPMLAKVIGVGTTRTQAARILATALERATIHGLVTNRDLLVNVLRHRAFLDGDTDTAFFETHGLATLSMPLADEEAERISARAAALASAAGKTGWRNVRSQAQRRTFTTARGEYDVEYLPEPTARPTSVTLDDGVRRTFTVARYGMTVCVDSSLGPVTLVERERFTDPADQVAAGSLLAPMPGTVIRVGVEAGAVVVKGQPLLWLEAMKMEHQISAPADGIVAELNVKTGQQVVVGMVLAVVKEDT